MTNNPSIFISPGISIIEPPPHLFALTGVTYSYGTISRLDELKNKKIKLTEKHNYYYDNFSVTDEYLMEKYIIDYLNIVEQIKKELY